ncbi:MAG: ECF-type riboflavin transporter substrate-binding protein [Anaerorhabdus sp.]
MKNSFFSTKTIVATGLGAALFMVLFMFVKVPSPIPETNLQIAYGVSAFLGALFGPICGFLTAFIGHALSDFISYGSPWWSWVIASGVAGIFSGLAFFTLQSDRGKINTKSLVKFVALNIVGNFVAWVGVAPVLDIVIYAEPSNLVFTQGLIAFVMNALCSCIIGGALLLTYSATRTDKGSLAKE